MQPRSFSAAISSRPEYSDGFTLVELLVALALVGLIAVMNFGSIQFGARVWERGEASSKATTELQVVQDLLRRQLASAAAATLSAAGDGPETLFEGTSTVVTFVAPHPARFAGGGLYRQRLYLDDMPGQRGLRLAWQPYEPDAPQDSPFVAGDSALLLPDLRELTFDYFDDNRRGGFAGWRDDWAQDRLPAQIRIRGTFEENNRRPWLPLVIRLRMGERP